MVILCDISGSMRGEPIMRLRQHLQSIWPELEPISKLVAFSDGVEVVESPRHLPNPHGGTNLAGALESLVSYMVPRVIVISDGFPDDQERALQVAARLPGTIDAIYVGPDGNQRAYEFMQKLASQNGGTACWQDLHTSQALLAPTIRGLLGLPAPIAL